MENYLSEGYGIIPKKFMKMKGVSIYAKAIMSYFLSFTGAGKIECWPTIETISNDLEIAQSTVKKSIQELINFNLIEKTKLYPGQLKTNNKYRLTILESVDDFEAYLDSREAYLDSRNKDLPQPCGGLPTSVERTQNNTSSNNTIKNKTDYQKIVSCYYELHERITGYKPIMGKAEGQIVNDLIKLFPADVIIEKLNLYYKNDNYWFTKNNGRSLKGFRAHFDEIVKEIKKNDSFKTAEEREFWRKQNEEYDERIRKLRQS